MLILMTLAATLKGNYLRNNVIRATGLLRVHQSLFNTKSENNSHPVEVCENACVCSSECSTLCNSGTLGSLKLKPNKL